MTSPKVIPTTKRGHVRRSSTSLLDLGLTRTENSGPFSPVTPTDLSSLSPSGIGTSFRNFKRRASSSTATLFRRNSSTQETSQSEGELGFSENRIVSIDEEPEENQSPDGIVFLAAKEHYTVGYAIGSGATATVFWASYYPYADEREEFPPSASSGSTIQVAIKMINTDFFSRTQIEGLRREIQIMSLCRHENVLPVYTSFIPNDSHHLWIISPLMTAGSCADLLAWRYKDGLPEPTVRDILVQLLRALEYLHGCHLVHRDVKAANLLLDQRTGLVRLGDFGVSSTLIDTLSGRTSFVGTPCWMAPEVIEQSKYDHKADIWSFGITAIELLTGRAPRATMSPMKVFLMTLQADPPALEDWERKVEKDEDEPPGGVITRLYSRTAKELAKTTLVKDPNERPTATKLLKNNPFLAPKLKGKSWNTTQQSGVRIVQELKLWEKPTVVEQAKSLSKRQPSVSEKTVAGSDWDFSEPTTSEPRASQRRVSPTAASLSSEATVGAEEVQLPLSAMKRMDLSTLKQSLPGQASQGHCHSRSHSCSSISSFKNSKSSLLSTFAAQRDPECQACLSLDSPSEDLLTKVSRPGVSKEKLNGTPSSRPASPPQSQPQQEENLHIKKVGRFWIQTAENNG